MRKSGFTEEQSIAILTEQERDVPRADVCRSSNEEKSHAISARTD